MTIVFVVLGIIALIILYLWLTYNSLVVLRERIKEAFSQIDVQLKRRADLIPNLIETVKGYVAHEKGVLEGVTQARTSLMQAQTPQEKARADSMLERTLKTLFAVAESYPDLKASQNFLNLQEELTDTENKVAASRQFYNSNVLEYNARIKSFPTLVVAQRFRFKEEEFFEAEDEEKSEVEVRFK